MTPHRIITREVHSLKPDSQNCVMFPLKTKVKEVMPGDIIELMEQCLIDPMTRQQAYSQEYMKFLSILENGIKFQDDHYELPLPFRNRNPPLPNKS